MLEDLQVHVGVLGCEHAQDRQQRPAYGGGERRDPDGPGGVGGGVEVEARGLQRGQHGHGVVGQPAPRGSEPDAPPLGLDQRGARLAGQHRELLGDGRGGGVHDVGDRAHRAEP